MIHLPQIKNFQCPICFKKYKRNENLIIHVRKRHKEYLDYENQRLSQYNRQHTNYLPSISNNINTITNISKPN